jgi:hypothetical protein
VGKFHENILLNENHQQNAQNNGQDSIVLSMMIVWVSALLSSVPGKGSKGSSRLPSEQHKMANMSHSNVHPPLPTVIIPKEIETANEPRYCLLPRPFFDCCCSACSFPETSLISAAQWKRSGIRLCETVRGLIQKL